MYTGLIPRRVIAKVSVILVTFSVDRRMAVKTQRLLTIYPGDIVCSPDLSQYFWTSF